MMCNRQQAILLPLIFEFLLLVPISDADVGTAASYDPPYLPTQCFGSDPNQFPAGNLFAAAGEGIWDRNASCGRQYLVKCLSSATQGACISDQPIQVMIVDRAWSVASRPSSSGTTMALSSAAYQMISISSAPQINIEFTQI